MKQRILQMPHPNLREIAMPFPPGGWSDAHLAVIQDLRDTFAATQNCIGLAANQIGQLHRVIVVDVTPGRTETYVMVNPLIVKESEDKQLVNDGCMSIFEGKKHANTKRPKRITIEWLDPRDGGKPRKQKFTGLLAAAIHHEVDHLRGILFIDRVAELQK